MKTCYVCYGVEVGDGDDWNNQRTYRVCLSRTRAEEWLAEANRRFGKPRGKWTRRFFMTEVDFDGTEPELAEKIVPQISKRPDFDEIMQEFRDGKRNIMEWNFAFHKEQNEDEYTAYIMGEGSSQCLTSKGGFKTSEGIVALFNSIGVKRVLRGVG